MTHLFCDGIRSVSLRHGVVRVELSQSAADGDPQLAGTLFVSEDQARHLLDTLERRLDELLVPRELADPNSEEAATRTLAPVDEDMGDLTS
jgi:hypothetical protein